MKLVKAKITEDVTISMYKAEGEIRIIQLLSGKVDGKPRVTKNQNVIKKVTSYLSNFQ